jgi:hypothetical protein
VSGQQFGDGSVLLACAREDTHPHIKSSNHQRGRTTTGEVFPSPRVSKFLPGGSRARAAAGLVSSGIECDE